MILLGRSIPLKRVTPEVTPRRAAGSVPGLSKLGIHFWDVGDFSLFMATFTQTPTSKGPIALMTDAAESLLRLRAFVPVPTKKRSFCDGKCAEKFQLIQCPEKSL
jgi:hypothetical protein